ncbi:MAG: hypothetical protein RLY87_1178 [Chloroflexota bacterium]
MIRLLTLFMLACSTFTMAIQSETAAPRAKIVTKATLTDIPLGIVQHTALPNAPIMNDRGILFGGIGSDVFHVPGTAADEFWSVTDRGPMRELQNGDSVLHTALIPEYTPMIVHLKIDDGVVTPMQYIPITTSSGKPVTGLPNIPRSDPQFWDATASVELPYNPNGLDVEGIVRTSSGEFWVADEYRPSLVRISATGRVIARYIPKGVPLVGADYPVIEALPHAYTQRTYNRGFEGLALSADEKTIFIVLQSPLNAPDLEFGSHSRTVRILSFDIAAGSATHEYVYRLEDATAFDPNRKTKQSDMKLSGVASVDQHRLLVLERTDHAFAVYRIDLRDATDIIGTEWSTMNTPYSLEHYENPTKVGITPVSKHLVLHSAVLRNMPQKIEGLTIVNTTTLALTNDNDFDVGELNAHGINQGYGRKSHLIVLKVPDITK